jgi:hypothetical protein
MIDHICMIALFQAIERLRAKLIQVSLKKRGLTGFAQSLVEAETHIIYTKQRYVTKMNRN